MVAYTCRGQVSNSLHGMNTMCSIAWLGFGSMVAFSQLPEDLNPLSGACLVSVHSPPPIFKVSLEMTNSTTLKCLWREHPTQLASSKHIAIIMKLSQMAAFKKKKVLKAKGTAERESKVCQKVIGRKPLFSGGWGGGEGGWSEPGNVKEPNQS